MVDCLRLDELRGKAEAKIQYARRIAASLSYLLVNQGDAAGLSICTDKLHLEVPPSRRPAHLERLFTTWPPWSRAATPAWSRPPHDRREDRPTRPHRHPLRSLHRFGRPRRRLQHLRYRKHDVSVFHLMDPQEIGFEFDRPHRFVDWRTAPPWSPNRR